MSMNSTAKSLQSNSSEKKKFIFSKNIYFISLVAIFCIVTFYFVNTKLVVNNVKNTTTIENQWYILTVPNVYPNGADYTYNLLTTDSTQYYAKRFGNRVVPLTTETRKFTAVNLQSSRSRTTTQDSEEEQQIIIYNSETGQREIQFYHPEVSYVRLPDALSMLDNLDENTSYEMALSFEKSFAFADARFMLDHNDTEWLWVDSLSDDDIDAKQEQDDLGYLSSFTANNVFGFPFTENTSWSFPNSFLAVLENEDIQNSEYAEQANEILSVLKENDEEVEGGKVRIIGAVVTGTPEELRKYQDLDFIRASSLGASVSVY